MCRWAVFIDVEGFSRIYSRSEGAGLLGLTTLTRGIFDILNAPTEKRGGSLFAHQISDGFVVVSEFREESLDRPVAIAAGLMKYMLRYGYVCRAGIAEGDFGDHSGCFDEVIRQAKDGHYLNVRDGVMTVTQVMGGAQINAYRVQDNPYRGPLLFIVPELVPRLDSKCLRFLDCGEDLACIDWLNSAGEMQQTFDEILGNHYLPPTRNRELLQGYLDSNPLHSPNKENAKVMLSLAVSVRLKTHRGLVKNDQLDSL